MNEIKVEDIKFLRDVIKEYATLSKDYLTAIKARDILINLQIQYEQQTTCSKNS